MAELTRTWRWAQYVPDLGPNRELPNPFFIKVKSGISKADLDAFDQRRVEFARQKPTPEAVCAVLGGLVEMGEEPLTIEGTPISTLEQFVSIALAMSSMELVLELFFAVTYFNSLSGGSQLFYERLSGGSAFTVKQSAARAAKPTAGR